MLTGRADPETLAAAGRLAVIETFDHGPVALPGAEVVQANFELPFSTRDALLPPGLHPTTPPTLVVVAWACPESPWGPFKLVQARLSCRSGVRPRGFVVGCVAEGDAAARALAVGWGLAATAGEIMLRRRYDATVLTVFVDGAVVLDLVGADPDPLGPGDVQYTVGLSLAHTPNGLRLVQVEPEYTAQRVERIRPRLDAFVGSAWGSPMLEPYHPVSGSVALADITLPRLRYVCRPDVLAFEGTEKVG